MKAELKRLVEKKVIEPVSEPTLWVSALALVVKKNGKLRVCIDPRPLNKALKREHFQLPVLEDLLPELAEGKVFSTLDLWDRFSQRCFERGENGLTANLSIFPGTFGNQ